MQEYVLICPKKSNEKKLERIPWMLDYLLEGHLEDNYDDLLYQYWCYPLDHFNEYFQHHFHNRYDYRFEDHLHTLYNELTKEISIIIVNRYQIIIKCDKIPYVVIQIVRNYYPTLRIFCRSRDFEEVKL